MLFKFSFIYFVHDYRDLQMENTVKVMQEKRIWW